MLSDVEILQEIEDLIRTAPANWRLHLEDDNTVNWLGRLQATFLDLPNALDIPMRIALGQIHTTGSGLSQKAQLDVRRLLFAARWKYRQSTGGPTGLAIDAGMVFDYFSGVSKIIQTARKDIFFVDPYLDGEFVERYLPQVAPGTTVRLLGRERQGTLVPAAAAFAEQHKLNVEVRSAKGFHDRFVFIDKAQCYQSGASFKDGARKTPTTLTEITDAFAQLLAIYESKWGSG